MSSLVSCGPILSVSRLMIRNSTKQHLKFVAVPQTFTFLPFVQKLWNDSPFSLLFFFPTRTAGSILGVGFDAFISDWDKISATVSNFCSLLQLSDP